VNVRFSPDRPAELDYRIKDFRYGFLDHDFQSGRKGNKTVRVRFDALDQIAIDDQFRIVQLGQFDHKKTRSNNPPRRGKPPPEGLLS